MNETFSRCADPAGDALVGNTLGSIARHIPGATAVLRRHRLDFCCGGDATLADAARVQGVDATKIAGELRALARVSAEVSDEPLPLIDHILERYHETHRRELTELIVMARRVEAVHAGHPELSAWSRAHAGTCSGSPRGTHAEGGADPLSDDPCRPG